MRSASGKWRYRGDDRDGDKDIFTSLNEIRDMPHRIILLPFLALMASAGCAETGGALLALNMASLPVIQRTPFDAVWSVATGEDCSMVHRDKGGDYCRRPEAAPAPPPFCSRSLGQVDCWRDPAKLTNRPRELADGPRELTEAQEAYRARRWRIF